MHTQRALDAIIHAFDSVVMIYGLFVASRRDDARELRPERCTTPYVLYCQVD